MKRALAILRFLRDCADRGEPAVLVTLTDVTGSAARAPGEQMAVAASGAALGSFSGGCVEAAVIAEAQDVLLAGQARLVRYGAGSCYIDLRLPCGGGIDLLFTPTADRAELDRAIDTLERRVPLMLRLTTDGAFSAGAATERDRTAWQGTAFVVRHDPVLRLVVMGHGAEPAAMVAIGRTYGADTLLLSPQAALVEEAQRTGTPARLLRIVGPADGLEIDRWTAVITLFHDHDWEIPLLLQVLQEQPVFIGAMGSRRTHQTRRQRLVDAGAETHLIDRVVGPVGLIKATRDPETLALSIMAQVVEYCEAARSRGDRRTASMNTAHLFDEQSAGAD